MCIEGYVLLDLWDSILYNISFFKLNIGFLVPYGLIRLTIIVTLKFFLKLALIFEN